MSHPSMLGRMTRRQAEALIKRMEKSGNYMTCRVVDRCEGGHAVSAWTTPKPTTNPRWDIAPRQVIVWHPSELEEEESPPQ